MKTPGRTIPQGTFVVLAIIGIGLLLMAGYLVYGLVQIALVSMEPAQPVNIDPAMNQAASHPAGIAGLAVIAYRIIDAVLAFGDRVFRWTRDFQQDGEEVAA